METLSPRPLLRFIVIGAAVLDGTTEPRNTNTAIDTSTLLVTDLQIRYILAVLFITKRKIAPRCRRWQANG